jgi:hypothetical protein
MSQLISILKTVLNCFMASNVNLNTITKITVVITVSPFVQATYTVCLKSKCTDFPMDELEM